MRERLTLLFKAEYYPIVCFYHQKQTGSWKGKHSASFLNTLHDLIVI